MILQNLTATFGCLNNASLPLESGLNVIQAPNESGKSTWLAFLRTMLYGFPTRERGALADKNRYAPWNGAAMSGRIALTDEGQALVLTRTTAHGGTPMGHFAALYSGTATPVAGMTGQNAGELLTGVPRPVFERSAFIRQGALAIDQDAELERRIASLLSSGEEDTSYIETEKRLRAALNQRRHNKTGFLPRAETEIAALQGKLARLRALRQQIDEANAALREAAAARQNITEKLSRHDQIAQSDAAQALRSARAALAQTEERIRQLRTAMEAAHIPPAEQLMQIKFNAANLLTTQVSMNHVQAQAEEAKKQTAAAKAAADAFPFAPAPPEAAAEAVRSTLEHYNTLMQRSVPSLPVSAALTLLSAGVLAGAAYGLQQSYWIVCAAAAVPLLCAALRRRSRKQARAEAQALLSPYGAEVPEEIDPMLVQYHKAYQHWMAQKDAEAQINASWQNFYQTYKRLSEEILSETSTFCPELENVHDISPLLEQGLRQWKQLQTLENRAGQLRARCEALQDGAAAEAPPPEGPPLQPPSESREALQAQLSENEQLQKALHSRMDQAAGEMAAIGDFITISAQLEALETRRDQAQEEYDAIALALEALSSANDTLQQRFSPALGRRAGEIFEALSGGRYHHILLDQSLQAAAEGQDAIARSAALLSQGARDQLYLAVRLAICELVLPAAKQVPLILDDALANFDDQRCAAALDWLLQASRERQILLFTCQNREAVYLQNHENVHIISLSEHDWH